MLVCDTWKIPAILQSRPTHFQVVSVISVQLPNFATVATQLWRVRKRLVPLSPSTRFPPLEPTAIELTTADQVGLSYWITTSPFDAE